ncbi:hypothetical protein CYMTET_57088 [Cymbomonas tetramitiformis]|uniref:EF-hand domain-containing protein n=1 Tax=Cymbomonas tetramitiformis TaxID=36881 RepID=A0AAE0ELN2_9CHLO|nr:hypothetical protein CYMTET_57088 [Cymbomonas tetramitiformis]
MHQAIKESIKQLFHRCDMNKNGYLNVMELENLVTLWARSSKHYLSSVEISKYARDIIAAADHDGDAHLSLPEFFHYVEVTAPHMFAELLGWQELFNCYVDQSINAMREDGLRALVREILFKLHGVEPNFITVQQHVVAVMREADVNGDGTLSFEEFMSYARDKPEFMNAAATRLAEAPVEGVKPSALVIAMALSTISFSPMDLVPRITAEQVSTTSATPAQ